jgi:hypothetical protein
MRTFPSSHLSRHILSLRDHELPVHARRPGGYSMGMQETRDPREERTDLGEKTLWSLGLLGAVASFIVPLFIIGAG